MRLGGATMGTTWSVTYVVEGAQTPEPAEVQADIEMVLEAVNDAMSTYRADSDISRFNNQPVQTPFTAGPAFLDVLQTARTIGTLSGGAYDVTVGPLVELWGFGASTQGYREDIPDPAAIAQAREQVGQAHLTVGDDGVLVKTHPVELDFSSLAKGYAVDEVARALRARGVARYLVEVGGEMIVAGLSPRGDPWQIAIEQPVPGARAIAAALRLTDIAVATSGDYRNFFEYEGKRYSHSIDPRTGYPVDHELVSVTVLHESAMQADAWATALTVLGLDAALALAREQSLAVYCIAQRDGELVHRYTEQMAPYLAQRDL